MRKAVRRAVQVCWIGISSPSTTGVDALISDVNATPWDDIEKASGLSRADIEAVGTIYANAKRVIINYGMGITQHRHGTGNVQQIANLLMLRGNIGKQGAGISPLRGHSNVQGDRTVGITEIPNDALLDGLERRSVSNRRATRDTMRLRPLKRSGRALEGADRSGRRILPWRCPILKSRSKQCGDSTLRSISQRSSIAPIS
jgi:anaerobic selenocysteine-containing dehydrogenase